MRFSLIKSTNDENAESGETQLSFTEDLLQITVKDRTIIYNISEAKEQELMIFDATRQFISLRNYVQTGFRISQAYEDPSKEVDGYLLDKIIYNLT